MKIPLLKRRNVPCDHSEGGEGVEGSEPVAEFPGPGHLHGHQPLSHLVLQLDLPLQGHPVHLGHELLLPLLAVGGRLLAARLAHSGGHETPDFRPLALFCFSADGRCFFLCLWSLVLTGNSLLLWVFSVLTFSLQGVDIFVDAGAPLGH